MSFGPQKLKLLFAGCKESELFENLLAEAADHTMGAWNFHARQLSIRCADLKSHSETLLPCVIFQPFQLRSRLGNVYRCLKIGRWAKTERGPLIGSATKSAVKNFSIFAFEIPMFRK